MLAEGITHFKTYPNRVMSVYEGGEVIAVHVLGEGEVCSVVTNEAVAEMRRQQLAQSTPL